MKLSTQVKLLEKKVKRDTNKLPNHNRELYYFTKLPRMSEHNTQCTSLYNNIFHLIKRYEKLMNVDVKSNVSIHNVGKSSHHRKIVIRIYFKESKK